MKSQSGNQNGRLVKDIIYGIIGGAIGTVVMGQVANLMYKLESEEKKKKEEELRKEPSYNVMVERIAKDVFGAHLSDEAKSKLGEAAHWGYGLAWGGVYGAVRNRVPGFSKAGSLPFGITFWFVGDEALNAVFKLTPPPQEFPIDAHLRGLVAHLVYAATADGVYRTLRKIEG